jgi:hypothetical protein
MALSPWQGEALFFTTSKVKAWKELNLVGLMTLNRAESHRYRLVSGRALFGRPLPSGEELSPQHQPILFGLLSSRRSLMV